MGGFRDVRKLSRSAAQDRKLTARQKEILRELQATETGEECPQSRGFFDRIKEVWTDLTD